MKKMSVVKSEKYIDYFKKKEKEFGIGLQNHLQISKTNGGYIDPQQNGEKRNKRGYRTARNIYRKRFKYHSFVPGFIKRF